LQLIENREIKGPERKGILLFVGARQTGKSPSLREMVSPVEKSAQPFSFF